MSTRFSKPTPSRPAHPLLRPPQTITIDPLGARASRPHSGMRAGRPRSQEKNFPMKLHRLVLSLLTLGFIALPLGGHAAEAGFKSIFNGKDLSGWEGNTKFWSVREGAITGQTTTTNMVDANTFL